MFAKLLKMEFRSTWNVLGILCLSLVGAGLLGGVAIRYLVGASAPKEWLEVLCTLAITAAVLFFIVCGVAALIVQIVRFYRSRFTDEGYLTFTLPVTTHEGAKVSLCLVDDGLIGFGAVAHFHDGHAGSPVVQHFGGGFLQNAFRQNRGACGKIIDSGHCFFLP